MIDKYAEIGDVVKKEYQRKGITKYASKMRQNYLKELGYKGHIFHFDKSNVATMNWFQSVKNDLNILKEENGRIYCSREYDE